MNIKFKISEIRNYTNKFLIKTCTKLIYLINRYIFWLKRVERLELKNYKDSLKNILERPSSCTFISSHGEKYNAIQKTIEKQDLEVQLCEDSGNPILKYEEWGQLPDPGQSNLEMFNLKMNKIKL